MAAVWTRDGRNWRIASGLTADEVRQQDERNKNETVPSRRCRRLRDSRWGTASPPIAMRPSGSRNPAMTTPGCTSGMTAD